MTKSVERPKGTALPGIELTVTVSGLCNALKECTSVVPWNGKAKVPNIHVGFGMDSWAIGAFGHHENYGANAGGDIATWIAIDPRRLLSLLSPFNKDGCKIKVTTGDFVRFDTPDGGMFSLRSAEMDNWPEVADDTAFKEELVLSEELAEMIADASAYVSPDSHRVVLGYVGIVVSSESTHVVATDTHCLYAAASPQLVDQSLFIPAVPARLSKEGCRILRNGDRYCMTLKYGRIVWRSMTGTFPQWERVIPTPEETDKWDTDLCAQDVIAATKRAMIYAKFAAGRVRFSLLDGLIRATGRSDFMGEISVPVGLITGSASCEVALNGNYVVKAMRTLGGTPHVRGKDSSRPFIFTNGNVRVVVMPMALA